MKITLSFLDYLMLAMNGVLVWLALNGQLTKGQTGLMALSLCVLVFTLFHESIFRFYAKIGYKPFLITFMLHMTLRFFNIY